MWLIFDLDWFFFQVREGEDGAVNPKVPGGGEERAGAGGRARQESSSVQPPGTAFFSLTSN